MSLERAWWLTVLGLRGVGWLLLRWSVLLAVGGLPGQQTQAHEIPSDVAVQVYLAPAGERLNALIRVPLAAMRDFDFATRGPGYLDLDRVQPQLLDAVEVWLLDDLSLFADGARLETPVIEAVRVALPSDRAFDDYPSARRALAEVRLPVTTNLYWEQALLDVALSYPIDSDRADFEVEASFARLGLTTLTRIQFLSSGGEVRGLGFTGNPGRLSLDPGMTEVFGRFLIAGFEHVLDGTDHLLFIFVLVLPLLRIRPLLVVITAFTLAHSITLAASMLELVPSGLWFPPLVEVLIAASIVFMALENLFQTSLPRRWLTAFVFGLVHGFGFSFALQDTLQFAGDHVLVSLAGFNLGIELGQLLVLVLLVLVLRLVGRFLPERSMTLVLSALAAHSAWHWMTERWTLLSAYSFTMPVFDAATVAIGMRWLMLLLVAGLVIWLLKGPFERWAEAARPRLDPVRDRPR